jgi:hypothetical protein
MSRTAENRDVARTARELLRQLELLRTLFLVPRLLRPARKPRGEHR